RRKGTSGKGTVWTRETSSFTATPVICRMASSAAYAPSTPMRRRLSRSRVSSVSIVRRLQASGAGRPAEEVRDVEDQRDASVVEEGRPAVLPEVLQGRAEGLDHELAPLEDGVDGEGAVRGLRPEEKDREAPRPVEARRGVGPEGA